MDLSNMTPKDKGRYEVAMELHDNFIKAFEEGDICEEIELKEILLSIRRAEYKRGKADGIAESSSVHNTSEDKNGD